VGREAPVRAVFADGADEGKLQLELPKLIFKGASRKVFEGEALKGVTADGAFLVLADGSRFELGEKPAASWAKAINEPKGRLDKIGVKAGHRVAVIGVEDKTFTQELGDVGAVPVTELKDVDLLFYGADSTEALARIPDLIPVLAETGALWIVSKKGKAATVKDVEVLAAAREAGLVDTKVVAFSTTLTSLRFTRRAAS
jgi:hypothetical protein